MNQSELEVIVKKHLHQAAPEANLDLLEPDDDIGRVLDIDSMDFYNMMVAISEELSVNIPEEEYGSLRTLKKIVEFLENSGQ
jgi:acyl carrier protein